MVYGVLAVLGSMGLVYLMIILSHCLVLYSVALAKQKWLCYVAGLCCLATFKVEPFSSWQVGAVSDHSPVSFPARLCPSPWVYLQGGLPGHPKTMGTSGHVGALTGFEGEGTVVPLSLGMIPQEPRCVSVASCWARERSPGGL